MEILSEIILTLANILFIFTVYQTLTLLIQFPNMKNYLEIEPITSSKFEVSIIYINRRLFYYAISLSFN